MDTPVHVTPVRAHDCIGPVMDDPDVWPLRPYNLHVHHKGTEMRDISPMLTKVDKT
jgi:hypothetical protein